MLRRHMASCTPDSPYRVLGAPYASACPEVRVSVHDNGLRVVELDRPRALHALSHEMVRAVRHALGTFRTDSTVRVVLFCAHNAATKSRAFCSGGDVIGTPIAMRGGVIDVDCIGG